MVAFSSPFQDSPSPKDTTPQTATYGTSPGPVPSSPSADYPNPLVITEVGTTGASFEDTFREAIVQSTSTVGSVDPGGSAPMESPFTDGVAKR